MKRNVSKILPNIYQISAVRRAIIIWLVFQVLVWVVFGIGYLSSPNAWTGDSPIDPSTATVGGWLTTFLYIICLNSIIVVIIVIGNMFVRFGPITPGLLILLWQGVQIGWVAGTNAFEVPFVSLAASNIQYLKVGLWETSAYVLACSITLPKSLFIAKTFPATQWDETKQIKDIHLSTSEKVLCILGFVFLVGAAIAETHFLVG